MKKLAAIRVDQRFKNVYPIRKNQWENRALLFFKKNWATFLLTLFIFLLTPILNRTQHGWEDALMRLHTRKQFSAPIKIVYFDENDIASLGGWPLARNVYAFVAERLYQLGVKVVGFDVYWGARSNGPDENDLALAAMLDQRENLCGSFYFEALDATGSVETRAPKLEWPDSLAAREKAITASGLHAPAEEFLRGPARYGFANLLADDRAMIREAPLFARNGNAIYPSFARVLAQRFTSEANFSTATRMRINYHVAPQDLPLIPVRELVAATAGSARLAELRGSLVLVGIISPQLGFTRPTPIAPEMPVVAIHAQALDNLLTQSALRPFPQWLWFIALALLALLFASLHNTKAKKLFVAMFVLALSGVLAAIGLWRVHSIFPLYAYLLGLLLLLAPGMSARLRRQRETLADEAAKREALEKEFRATVQAATQAQAETTKARQRYQQELARLRRELTVIAPQQHEAPKSEDFPEIVHAPHSPMAKILAELGRIAATDAPVLITGESGAGKELIAHALHQKSQRSHAPFLALNCAALPESLLESELFGYEKGAFTGAQTSKLGLFEAAHQGAIFLDEISAMPLAFQAKLLRVLQNGQFFRVGATQARTVDVRVLAAANRPLPALVEQGAFREDLYFRLNVLPLNLPPLRERPMDLPLLLSHFLRGASCKISEEALRALQEHAWPGNIRELQNLTARMRVLGENAVISSEWVRQQLPSSSAMPTTDSIDEQILRLYRELEFRNDANTQIAAALGNLHRSTVTEYLKGMTFLYFAEAQFQLEAALRRFNPQPEAARDARLKSRLLKYLHNLRAEIDPRQSLQSNLERITERIRKMPQRYHAATLECAKACWQGKWRLE